MVLPTSPRPKKQIIVVDSESAQLMSLDATVGYWVFGPGTKHRWPRGDFHYNRTNDVTPSAFTLDELLNEYRGKIYDPDMVMDKGL